MTLATSCWTFVTNCVNVTVYEPSVPAGPTVTSGPSSVSSWSAFWISASSASNEMGRVSWYE
jgi:hypothetical protein